MDEWIFIMLRLLIVLGATIAALSVSGKLINKITDRISNDIIKKLPVRRRKKVKDRITTLTRLFAEILNFVILGIGGLTALGIVGVDIGPMLTALGLAGISLSFGVRDIIKDIVMGIILIIEGEVLAGDCVSIEGNKGIVQKVGLRTLTLKTPEGAIVTVANRKITIIKRLKKAECARKEERAEDQKESK